MGVEKNFENLDFYAFWLHPGGPGVVRSTFQIPFILEMIQIIMETIGFVVFKIYNFKMMYEDQLQ